MKKPKELGALRYSTGMIKIDFIPPGKSMEETER